jgi:hypothetical protein
MSLEANRSGLTARGRIGLITAVALLVATVSLIVARPADAQGDVHVFVGGSSEGAVKFLDFGHDGLKLGDRLAARGPLKDGSHATEVGSFSMDCLVVKMITDGPDGSGGVYRCSYLLRLADGHLIIEGWDPHGPGVYTMAVLGGTEAYAGATGDATLTDGDEGTDFVIDLT